MTIYCELYEHCSQQAPHTSRLLEASGFHTVEATKERVQAGAYRSSDQRLSSRPHF
jgi:hypothetical protein